jgi:phage baseplate assembly protein W
MITDYYKMAFQPDRLMKKKEHPKCSLSDSVAGMIHLIVVTGFDECKFDESFGCEIWEHDFENVVNSQLYREQLRDSIQQSIEKHEPRINNIKVTIQIEQIDYRLSSRRVKSRIKIKVDATLVMTNESFSYTDQIFIGPLSYYL